MGRFLGSHESEELDRPDLNKCPDCRCFFAGDNCPLCGKLCPEEMRAGNRAKVKASRSAPNPNAGRVTFIPWYHSWLCIILMLFVMPIVGIILLCTSPYRTRTKLLVVGIIVIGAILLSVVPLLLHLALSGMINSDVPPLADTTIPKEDYVLLCDKIASEDFYRDAEAHMGERLQLEVLILSRITDVSGQSGAYANYYLCESVENGNVRLLIRDCVISGSHNFVAGDRVLFYGEGAGNRSVTESDLTVTDLPCLNAAYAERIQ